jgi:hypothetical protein
MKPGEIIVAGRSIRGIFLGDASGYKLVLLCPLFTLMTMWTRWEVVDEARPNPDTKG